MNEKINVMIIDDSALMRNLIKASLSNHNLINVVGTAINGRFGLKKLNILKPDIIILDLEMPDMNGIEFLKERKRLDINIPVIILSAHAQKGAKITFEALALGASDFILKPSGYANDINKTKDRLIEMIIALGKPSSYKVSDAYTVTPLDIQKEIHETKIEIEKKIPKIEKIIPKNYLQTIKTIPDINIIVIGISTGGPSALRNILPCFPSDFSIPIVIVQHMPAGFTFEFAKNLNTVCQLEVKETEENDVVKPGRILIAPGDKHILFNKKKLGVVIKLDENPPVNGHRPSVDVLFKSTAEVYEENSLACIMTGMGRDGANNIGMILEKGGITIAQNQETSIVFGMPRIAIELGNIQIVSPLNEIPDIIMKIIKKKYKP